MTIRHDGINMANMNESDYQNMIELASVEISVVNYFDPQQKSTTYLSSLSL